ncbi:MAG: cell envelope integrity EipB family protein [Hyphomicrobiaceae bacterium]
MPHCLYRAGPVLAAGLAMLSSLALQPARTAPADEIVLVPHRAIYDLRLEKTRPGAGVSDLSGRLVYEIQGNACVGYTQTMRFVTRMTNQEGNILTTDLRSSSWEDGAGKRLRFDASTHRDEQPPEATRGEAARTGEAIRIELDRPKKKKLDIRSATLFPIQHSLALISAAQAGQTIFTADLYDGSEKGEKVYATTAAIGKRRPPGANKDLPAVKNAEKLDDHAAWPIALSYFDLGKDREDSAPSYELAYLFFDNGVTRLLSIDYSDFAIRAPLKELTFLGTGQCEKKS